MPIDYLNSTPVEIIKELLCQNRGTQNFLSKDELISIGKIRGLEFDNCDYKKSDLCDMLLSVYTVDELQRLAHTGISSYHWQKKFNITNAQLKKLAKLGYIQVTGKERFRAYGSYRYAALYSITDFCNITVNDVHVWLDKAL